MHSFPHDIARTTPRRRTRLLFGAASVALVGSAVLSHFASAAGGLGIPANAPLSVDAPSPTAAVLLPNGVTLRVEGVGGSVGKEKREWEADGSVSADDKAAASMASPADTSPPNEKHRSLTVETHYAERQQPRFVWAGEDTPSDGQLLAGQSSDGKQYYFDPITKVTESADTPQTAAVTITSSAKVTINPQLHGAKNTKSALAQMMNVYMGEADFPKDAPYAAVRAAVAAGGWSDVVHYAAKAGEADVAASFGQVRFRFNAHPRPLSDTKSDTKADNFDREADKIRMRLFKDSAVVGISYALPVNTPAFDCRLAAFDKWGRIVAFPQMTTRATDSSTLQASGKTIYQQAACFSRAMLPRIAEFRLLIRPFNVVTFHHVALEPQAPTKPASN